MISRKFNVVSSHKLSPTAEIPNEAIVAASKCEDKESSAGLVGERVRCGADVMLQCV